MAGGPDPEELPAATDAEREKAAGTIQKNYRGHRTRRQVRGFGLDPQTRWIEAVKDAQYQQLTTPTPPMKSETADACSTATGQSVGKLNWTRATKIVQRAAADEDSMSGDSDLSDSQDEGSIQKMSPEEKEKWNERRAAAKSARKKSAKMMDLQYFLEMVDQKHRYGSHLRKYHAYWKTLDTDQSFFYWLDHGDGLHMDMPECSRKKLDTEQVRYLSREERLHYMVRIDADGLLRWVKNGELVWTKDELYKDSIQGIVGTNENVPEYKYNIPPPGAEESSSSSEDEEDESHADSENDADDRYVNEDFHQAKGPEKLKYVSAAVLFNHMVRNSMKKGHKWIFVAGRCSKVPNFQLQLPTITLDTSFHLYIGYKQSGAFQHSSFMHGSRITAAGVIKVKHGQLRSLAPLSGHYRPLADNFKSFVHSLEDEGCDMSRVNISKSYAILIGMEKYTKSKKKADGAIDAIVHQKDKLLHPEKVKAEEEAEKDKSQSAQKEREWLEQEEQLQINGKEKKGSGLVKRLTNKLKIGRSKKDEIKQSEITGKERGIGSTGPEGGVPAP